MTISFEQAAAIVKYKLVIQTEGAVIQVLQHILDIGRIYQLDLL